MESIQKDSAYQIHLHFKQQAVNDLLMPFVCRESGLYIYTFDAVCRHVTPHAVDHVIMAGFEITGDVPSAVKGFLQQDLSSSAP